MSKTGIVRREAPPRKGAELGGFLVGHAAGIWRAMHTKRPHSSSTRHVGEHLSISGPAWRLQSR